MQIMGKSSSEFGNHKGLGWIDSHIIKVKSGSKSLKIPHVGWNDIDYNIVHSLKGFLNFRLFTLFTHIFFLKILQ